jgi:hypothetical protein
VHEGSSLINTWRDIRLNLIAKKIAKKVDLQPGKAKNMLETSVRNGGKCASNAKDALTAEKSCL